MIARIIAVVTLVAGSFFTVNTSFAAESKIAIFAGGCFWCIEKDFEHVAGVVDVQSGYIGGTTDNPTYKNHTKAKHLEAVEIKYDPEIVSYDKLLNIFWRSVDPTDAGGQFCDRGHSYSTAVFALDSEQMEMAEASKKMIDESGLLSKPIVTPIREASVFYPAETYHQDYYKKNPFRYGYYRKGCGRDRSVKALWGKEAYFGIDKNKGS